MTDQPHKLPGRNITCFAEGPLPMTDPKPGQRMEIVPERRHEAVEIAVFLWHIVLLLVLAAVAIAAGIGLVVGAALLLK